MSTGDEGGKVTTLAIERLGEPFFENMLLKSICLTGSALPTISDPISLLIGSELDEVEIGGSGGFFSNESLDAESKAEESDEDEAKADDEEDNEEDDDDDIEDEDKSDSICWF